MPGPEGEGPGIGVALAGVAKATNLCKSSAAHGQSRSSLNKCLEPEPIKEGNSRGANLLKDTEGKQCRKSY